MTGHRLVLTVSVDVEPTGPADETPYHSCDMGNGTLEVHDQADDASDALPS